MHVRGSSHAQAAQDLLSSVRLKNLFPNMLYVSFLTITREVSVYLTLPPEGAAANGDLLNWKGYYEILISTFLFAFVLTKS